MGMRILIYTLSTCSHCKATKRFLNDNGIEYDYVDIDLLQGERREEILDEVREINPSLSFPTILIGKRTIVGFREDEIKEALKIS
jgi:glutaredoxin-like protein NrdH